ncbi:MAG: hypothetical protein IJI68_00590, partial [Eggerthellaceae bacterium]|nr:hypothetical protein [Eggerthellaceae bacterium]
PGLSWRGALVESRAKAFETARASSTAAATSSNVAGGSGAGADGGATGCLPMILWDFLRHLSEQNLAVVRFASNSRPHSSHTLATINPPIVSL